MGTVGIFTTARNAEPFVGEMLESVLAQTHADLELVVVDCDSVDATAEVVARYASEDERVRLIRMSPDPGWSTGIHTALAAARGELLCWMDADDIWAPEKLELQREALERRPDAGFAYGYFDPFDSETGETLVWPEARADLAGDVLPPLLVGGNFIGSSTVMMRRRALEGALSRMAGGRFLTDYHLWLAISARWRAAHVPSVLLRYRRHPGSMSVRPSQRLSGPERLIQAQNALFADFPELRGEVGFLRHRALARWHRRAARLEPAWSPGRAGHRVRAVAHAQAARVSPAPARALEARINSPLAEPVGP